MHVHTQVLVAGLGQGPQGCKSESKVRVGPSDDTRISGQRPIERGHKQEGNEVGDKVP